VYNVNNTATSTVSGNTVTTTQADAIRVSSSSTSDCQNIQGNILSAGGGNDAIEISGGSGVPDIQQAGAADLAAVNTLNSGGVHITSGTTPDYNTTCP